MLSGLHLLLTYNCLYECDHCFLYCHPGAEGTFTLAQLERALDQGVEAGASSVYLEGGEPFLYYPLLLEALRLARVRGLDTGLVSNCYWATGERDAELWLKPLRDLGLVDLSFSDDAFHSEDPAQSPAKVAARVAAALGLPVGSICIEPPTIAPSPARAADGAVIGGDVLLKGRAADKLVEDLPRQTFERFDTCPHEELETPGRVHVDPFGNVFVCQGISIGNIWQRPLQQIMQEYDPAAHPIVGPLLRGGPAELARVYGVPDESGFVEHCHLCFLVRRGLLERFPEMLRPAQVYGRG